MTSRDITQSLRDIDAALIPLAMGMRRLARTMQTAGRPLYRIPYTKGDRHIERIVKEILAGEPGRDPAIRLLAASDLAQVLDRS